MYFGQFFLTLGTVERGSTGFCSNRSSKVTVPYTKASAKQPFYSLTSYSVLFFLFTRKKNM